MFNQRLPEFNQVSAGKTSMLKVPKYALTLKQLEFVLGGTFTKAQMTEIRVKIGTKTVIAVSGSQLDTINQYRGLFADAYHLTLDLSERDARDIVAEELGGLDLSKLQDDVYVEVDISGAAVSPTLFCYSWWTAPQGDSADPKQLMRKLVRLGYNASATGQKNSVPFDPKTALVTRAYCFFGAGSDWTTSANGNIPKFEVKKNGQVIHEMTDLDNRYAQQRYRRVPQSRLFVVDFIIDNNLSAALVTADAAALEWNVYPTVAEPSLVVVFEVLDKPYNL